jgi:hypothetical protein
MESTIEIFAHPDLYFPILKATSNHCQEKRSARFAFFLRPLAPPRLRRGASTLSVVDDDDLTVVEEVDSLRVGLPATAGRRVGAAGEPLVWRLLQERRENNGHDQRRPTPIQTQAPPVRARAAWSDTYSDASAATAGALGFSLACRPARDSQVREVSLSDPRSRQPSLC